MDKCIRLVKASISVCVCVCVTVSQLSTNRRKLKHKHAAMYFFLSQSQENVYYSRPCPPPSPPPSRSFLWDRSGLAWIISLIAFWPLSCFSSIPYYFMHSAVQTVKRNTHYLVLFFYSIRSSSFPTPPHLSRCFSHPRPS